LHKKMTGHCIFAMLKEVELRAKYDQRFMNKVNTFLLQTQRGQYLELLKMHSCLMISLLLPW